MGCGNESERLSRKSVVPDPSGSRLEPDELGKSLFVEGFKN
jgi:hypothetical protein